MFPEAFATMPGQTMTRGFGFRKAPHRSQPMFNPSWRPRIQSEPHPNHFDPSCNVRDAPREVSNQTFFEYSHRVRVSKHRVSNAIHRVACHTNRFGKNKQRVCKINSVSAVQNTVSAVLYMVSAKISSVFAVLKWGFPRIADGYAANTAAATCGHVLIGRVSGRLASRSTRSAIIS